MRSVQYGFFVVLKSCFPVMLFTYFLNDFGMVPVVAVISGITFVVFFIPHVMLQGLYILRIYLASFFFTFVSPAIEMSINRHVSLSFPWIMMSCFTVRIVVLLFRG